MARWWEVRRAEGFEDFIRDEGSNFAVNGDFMTASWGEGMGLLGGDV